MSPDPHMWPEPTRESLLAGLAASAERDQKIREQAAPWTPVLPSEQLVLDVQPLVTPPRVEGETIQEKFESFHALNPWVYAAFVKLTDDWVARGRKRIGIGMLTEVLRWQYGRQTRGDEFRINNNYRSRYVRLLLAEHPEFADSFETRELRAA
jgi:hypothetical protein